MSKNCLPENTDLTTFVKSYQGDQNEMLKVIFKNYSIDRLTDKELNELAKVINLSEVTDFLKIKNFAEILQQSQSLVLRSNNFHYSIDEENFASKTFESIKNILKQYKKIATEETKKNGSIYESDLNHTKKVLQVLQEFAYRIKTISHSL